MKPGSKPYRFTAFLFRRVFFRVRIEGAENEPQDGAVILCSNHISFCDPILISAGTKRLARFMAKKELFSVPILGRVIRSFGAFPVNRGHADANSLKHCLELLKQNEMVGIFPQGTRQTGVPPTEGSVKNGLGMLAVRSGAAILPVCVMPKNYRTRPFGKITIRIGKPIPPEEYRPGELCPSEYDRITRLAFREVCALADPAADTRPKEG